MNSKAIFKDTLILFIITVISGCLLGYVYGLTKDPIARQQEETKLNAYSQVMQNASDFKEEFKDQIKDSATALTDNYGTNGIEIINALTAYDQEEIIGYVIQVVDKDGFNGDIEITVGIDTEGVITGVEILSIDETVGLGMNAQNEEFRNQYVGKKVESFTVTKSGSKNDNEIDALSGATIASNAMTYGVNGALDFYNIYIVNEGR